MIKYTTETWIAAATKQFKGLYGYDLAIYTGAAKKIKIRCSIHGVFEQKAGVHLNYGRHCPKCALERARKSIGIKSKEEREQS